MRRAKRRTAMSKRRIADESLFWFGVALIVTLGPAWNAHRPLEARPLQAGVQVGCGSVKGRVVDASSGRPVQGATVNVSVDGGRSKLASVVVGEDGSFAVDNIPPTESLLVRAVLSGYAGGIYGQRSPILSGDSAGVVSIRADDHLLDVTLPLWKYGSIAGTVTGESGGPAVGVTVRAWRQTYVGGHRALAEGFSPSGRTDERGQYRLAQVLPGSYVVGIPETVAPQSARFEAVTRTLFYPSTTNANDATAIDLSSSLDQTGIDFDETETAKASLWRISGDLEGWVSDRGPAVVDLTRQGHLGGPGTEVVTSTRSDPGNHFSFSRVPPGEYQIKVTSYPTWSPGTTGLLQGGSGLPPATPGLTLPAVPQGPTLWAAISVAVTDGDVTDVHVDLRAGARIRGAIQCDCGSVGLDEIAGR
ncbi:MAG TPA: carboxypeptidase-like regulatory domain-containing protein, partial [Vicinamibacterales bacterium]